MNTRNESPRRKIRPSRRIVFGVFSTLVTVGILGYLFQYVSFGQVVDIIVNMDRGALLVFVALSLSMSLLRTWRYLLMLRISGFRPGRVALFLVVIVRNFFSDILPARIGTLVYVFLVTSRLGIPFGAAASSFALAFLFDMIALAPLLLVGAALAGGVSGIPPLALVAGGVVLLAISTLLVAALPLLARVAENLIYAARPLPESLREKWARAMNDTGGELERIRREGVYWKLVILSLGVRLGKYGSLYALLYAMVAPLGYTLEELPPARVLLGLVAPELVASLPVSGIGGFGAYEGAWAFVFGILVFPVELAKLTAISHHLFTQAYGAILGLSAMVVLLLPFIRWVPRSSNRDNRG